MAVATSFFLIGVPNVETLSITAFLVGFLFPLHFALVTVMTMAITWEILASIVFAFSGVTFLFKILAWLLIALLGISARKIGMKYFVEFSLMGAISGILFDILVTVPIAFFFVDNQSAFLSVLVANLVVGIVFTLSHTISNALLFAMIPFILKTVLPLLHDNYGEIIQARLDLFEYLKNGQEFRIIHWGTIGKKRLFLYVLTIGLLITVLSAATIIHFAPQRNPKNSEMVEVELSISYNGVLNNESHSLEITANRSIFSVLEQVAIINYSMDFGEVYVQAINHVWENLNLSQHYWIYYVNGDPPMTGAGSYFPSDGDVILWNYEV